MRRRLTREEFESNDKDGGVLLSEAMAFEENLDRRKSGIDRILEAGQFNVEI